MRRAFLLVLCLVLLFLGSGCDFIIRLESPTPTAVPPAPPGSACAAITMAQLQAWMDEKLPRQEREVAGGVVYLDAPQVTNCAENTVYFQVRVGYQGGSLTVGLGLLEEHFDLRYYPEQGNVCLDLHALVFPGELQAQGVDQVGQEIKVAKVRSGVDTSLQGMPAETRQEFDHAISRASIEGGDPQTQGIGTEAAGVLLDWVVAELLKQFNGEIAKLIGVCVPVQ